MFPPFSEALGIQIRALLPCEIREVPVPDPFLIGNGAWCSCCFPKGRPDTSRFAVESTWRKHIRKGCNECAGKGRVAFSAERIVADTSAEARRERKEARA